VTREEKSVRYKVVTESRLLMQEWSGGKAFDRSRAHLPPTLFKGVMRHVFQMIYESEGDVEKYLFGSVDAAGGARRGAVVLSDLRCIRGDVEDRIFTPIDPKLGGADAEQLHIAPALGTGAEFEGTVEFQLGAPGLHVNLGLTARLTSAQWGIGRGRQLGYGKFRVELLDRSSLSTVFISYSWEDARHNAWVAKLANELVERGTNVIFDRRSLNFAKDVPPDEISTFMAGGILRADRVVAVLTPQFKEKAERGVRGVGFEYRKLLNEPELAPELARYIAVLRRGDADSSVPTLLKGAPLVDMREGREEAGYATLLRILAGHES
jgi:hypothetical protein